MFVPFVLVCSIGIALVRGGRLKNLAALQVHHLAFFFVPLLLQIVAFSPLGDIPVGDHSLARFVYTASLGFAAWALWMNRHLPGIVWIALGLFLNFLVIALNGGFMPVGATAREYAGLTPVLERDMNLVPMTDATLLPWLGDILPLPRGIPFATVFSIGDLLIALGGVIFTQKSLAPERGEQTRRIDET